MKRSQWIRWGIGLCKAGLIVVLASLLTIYTTYSIVHVYLQDLLRPVAGLIGQRTNVEFVQLLTQMVSSGNTMEQAFPVARGSERDGRTASVPNPDDGSEAVQETSDSEAMETSGLAQEEKIITVEDMLRLRELWGKEVVDGWVQRLIGQMNHSDMQRLASLMDDGMTPAELIEVLQLLKPYMGMMGEE